MLKKKSKSTRMSDVSDETLMTRDVSEIKLNKIILWCQKHKLCILAT